MRNKNAILNLFICGLPTACAVALLAGARISRAAAAPAPTAADNASNYTTQTWPAQNGGVGFGPWKQASVPNGGSAGTYFKTDPAGGIHIATSTGTAGAGTGTNTANAAWGLYANGGTAPTEDISRTLNTALTPNQSFSIAWQSGGIGNAGSSAGFILQNGGTTVFQLAFIGGDKNDLSITDKNGTTYAAAVVGGGGKIPFADLGGGIVATFTPGAANSTGTPYVPTINPASGNTRFNGTLKYTGTVATSAINQFDIFDHNTTQDNFFNSPTITTAAPATPKAATELTLASGLAAVGAMGLLGRRKRKTA